MGKTLDAATTSQIREEIDRTVQSGVVPGILYYAVDQDGDYIFSHVSGNRGIASKEPNTRDTVFWIASLTKLITSIACMQLVEQGQLRLDDPEQVAQLAPELSTMKVLERDGSGGFILEDQNTPITLRMLLTHTGTRGTGHLDCVRLTLLLREQPASDTPSMIASCTTGRCQLV